MIIYSTWCEKLKPPGKAKWKGRRKKKQAEVMEWVSHCSLVSVQRCCTSQTPTSRKQLYRWIEWAFLTSKAAKIIPVPWVVALTSSLKHFSANNAVWNMNLSLPRHLQGFLSASAVTPSQISGLREWVQQHCCCSWASQCPSVEVFCWESAELCEQELGLLHCRSYAADLLAKSIFSYLSTDSVFMINKTESCRRRCKYFSSSLALLLSFSPLHREREGRDLKQTHTLAQEQNSSKVK